MPAEEQYILLPTRGMQAPFAAAAAVAGGAMDSMHSFLTALRPMARPVSIAPKLSLRVLDSIHENGAKLVQIAKEDVSALRAAQPGLRLVPVVYYTPAVNRYKIESRPTLKAAAATSLRLNVVLGKPPKPVAGATVVAFTDFSQREGVEAITTTKGAVSLALASGKKIERLYVYPKLGAWGYAAKNVVMKTGMTVPLAPIDLQYKDVVRYLYGKLDGNGGAGIKIGVIDTGAGPHPELNIAGGVNTVVGEQPNDYGDNGEGHGTHVAGIIAAQHRPPSQIRGVAPGVELRSYRVFAKGAGKASNYSITKAIDRAVADGCDIVNMSLGGGPVDDATKEAISDAYNQGTISICAAGNDGVNPVSFPSSDSLAIAVTAIGRSGTFPPNTTSSESVGTPKASTDPKFFFANFSNYGVDVDLTGPGVGVISTVPGGYGVMDGTSMACPAVTGMAARILSQSNDLRTMSRDETRSRYMVQSVLAGAKKLGLGATYEGQGALL